MHKILQLSRWSLTDVGREMQDNILPLCRRSSTELRGNGQNAVEDRWLNGHHIFAFGRLGVLVSLLSVLCAPWVSIYAQEWKMIDDGVEYAHVDHKIGNDPVKINLLRLDLKKVRLDVHHALDKAIGVELTSAIAERHGAIAAINGGFFRNDKSEFAGDPTGLLMVDGRLLSESEKDRVTLIIRNTRKESHTLFAHSTAGIFLLLGGRDAVLEISGINRERKSGEAVLYDGDSAHRPPVNDGDLEIWIGRCSRPKLRPGRADGASRKCKEVDIVRNGARPVGATPPVFILSIDKNFPGIAGRRAELDVVEHRRKKPIILFIRLRSDGRVFLTDDTVDITNGVARLIKDGQLEITWEQEKASKSFAETRHPRTAVAKLKDGKLLLITIDGRQPGVSVGMNLQELAEYILSLGATDAMNLDGGGSTTMYVAGKVLNTPSEKDGERKVSDAILVTLRKNTRAAHR